MLRAAVLAAVVCVYVAILSWEPRPNQDETWWINAVQPVTQLVLEGNFSPSAWWEVDTTLYGNLNLMLPKVVIGLAYESTLRVYRLVTGKPEPAWDTPWDPALTYRENVANGAVPGGVHAFGGRMIPIALVIATCLLVVYLLRDSRESAFLACILVALHPIVLQYGGKLQTDSWYWASSLAAVVFLIHALERPQVWLRSLLVFGVCVGIASNAKIVAMVTFGLVLVVISEWEQHRGALGGRRKWTGYAVYAVSVLGVVYVTNPQLWMERFAIRDAAAEIAEIRYQGFGIPSEELAAISTDRVLVRDTYPNLYAAARPLELVMLFPRTRAALRLHVEGYPWRADNRFVEACMTALKYLWFALPLAAFAILKVIRGGGAPRERVLLVCFVVNLAFVLLTIPVNFERFYMPSVLYAVLLAGAGLQCLIMRESSPEEAMPR